MAAKFMRNKVPPDAAWTMPVQRIFEKFAAEPFELIVGSRRTPESRKEFGNQVDGMLEAKGSEINFRGKR
jgi:hypothetical protein